MRLTKRIMVVALAATAFLILSLVLRQENKFPYKSVCVFGNLSVIGDQFCERSPAFSDGPDGPGWRGWAYLPLDAPLPAIGTKINSPLWRVEGWDEGLTRTN
jgi:hypothetical protein